MAKGFYTDTTLCIGCKACQVACHQWNQLPAEKGGRTEFTGDSYDNTQQLSALNWRHVKFIEQIPEDRHQDGFLQGSWLRGRTCSTACGRMPRGCPPGHHPKVRLSLYPEDINGCGPHAACPSRGDLWRRQAHNHPVLDPAQQWKVSPVRPGLPTELDPLRRMPR